MRWSWPILWVIVGCTNDEPEETGSSWSVSDNVAVHEVEGTLELQVDGRTTFAVHDRLQANRFTETWASGFGQYVFERTDEVAEELAFTGAEETDDGLILSFEGATILVSADTPERTRFRVEVDADHDSVSLPVRCDDGGSFHGFGEQYDATNQKGFAFDLLVQEQGVGRDGSVPFVSGGRHQTYFPMPYYLDGRGFGVLLQTDHRTRVDLCATDPEVAWIEPVQSGPLEWVVFHGPEPLDVIRQLGDVVGRPALPPDWAFGTWICTQGGAEAVREQVEFLADNDIDVAALWIQDWTGSARNIDGGYGVNYRWEADETELYPDLAALVDELHAQDLRVLAYVNPFIDPSLPNHYDDLVANGGLPLDEEGEPYLFFGPRTTQMSVVDLFDAAGQQYTREALGAAIDTYDLDGWMADFAEWLPLDAEVGDGTPGMEAHNRYPVEWQRLNREVWEEKRPDGDFVNFGRSGWTGVQGASQIHWAGDQEADWHPEDGLPTVVPALITLGLSGQPNVTHDIAGFSGGPSDKELYLRWVELGAFTPFMRTHDGADRDDNHRFDTDTETTAHFRRFSAIHDLLALELQALAAEGAETSSPMVRHLMLHYPDDPMTWDLSDQYLLGPDLLVAPVIEPGADSREVYFPKGSWFHVWTGDMYEGPGSQSVPAPVGSPPVFSRDADRTDLRAVP